MRTDREQRDAVALVGRAEQIEAIDRRIEQATCGNGGVLLVGGEAGVGKSALVSAALSRRQLISFRAAAASSSAAPYAPVVTILRARERSEPGWLATTGPLWRYLSTLLPEIAPQPETHSSLTLADALSDALRSLAFSAPAVVVFEDLQWSDEATLDLLPRVAATLGEVPLLIVGLYRSDEINRGHPLRRVRADLRRRQRLAEVALEPLDEAETADLIARITGRVVAPDLVRVVFDRTGGIPFFIEEITAALQATDRLADKQGRIQLASNDVPLPETVRDAVRLRADRLSAEGRGALELAAIIGAQVDLSLLTEAEENALDEAVEVGLVREAAGGVASFRHALVREGVYADVAWTRRRAYHRRIAEQLESRSARPELVAEHWLGARETERARKHLVDAAEAFCAVHAHRDAARASRRALELWPEGVEEGERLRLLERFGACAELCGDLAEAARAWEEVRDAHVSAGRNELVGDVARRLAGAYELLGMPERTRSAREQAATAFEASGRIADAVTERIAIAERLELAGSGHAALAILTGLADPIARSGSVDLRVRALALEGEFRAKLGDREAGITAARDAISLALENGATAVIAEAYYRLGATLENACDHNGAVEAYSEARGFCLSQKIDGLAQICFACMLPAVLLTGQWSRTLEVSQLVLRSPDSPDVARAKAKVHIAIIASLRGNSARARRLAEETYVFSQQTMLVPIEVFSTWALARAAELEGNVAEALERCRELVRRARNRDEIHYTIPPLRYAATLFGRHGDLRDIAATAEILSRAATSTAHPESLGPLAHALGELALKNAEPDAAAEQFERAQTLLSEAGLPYERAETQLRGGMALHASGRYEDAVERFTDAYRTAKRLAARPLAMRAAEALRATGAVVEQHLGARAAGEAGSGGLSPRELEVLRLVTEGMTNRQIADRLFVSKRTVDMHMRNVLSRLGCRSRVDAVGRARALQLVP